MIKIIKEGKKNLMQFVPLADASFLMNSMI